MLLCSSDLEHGLNSILDLPFTICADLVSSSVKWRDQDSFKRVTVTTKVTNSSTELLRGSASDTKKLSHALDRQTFVHIPVTSQGHVDMSLFSFHFPRASRGV